MPREDNRQGRAEQSQAVCMSRVNELSECIAGPISGFAQASTCCCCPGPARKAEPLCIPEERIARKKSLWLQFVRGVGMNLLHDKVFVVGNCRTSLYEQSPSAAPCQSHEHAECFLESRSKKGTAVQMRPTVEQAVSLQPTGTMQGTYPCSATEESVVCWWIGPGGGLCPWRTPTGAPQPRAVVCREQLMVGQEGWGSSCLWEAQLGSIQEGGHPLGETHVEQGQSGCEGVTETKYSQFPCAASGQEVEGSRVKSSLGRKRMRKQYFQFCFWFSLSTLLLVAIN